MNKLWVIARKDIGEAFRSRSTYIFIIVMMALTLSYGSSYSAGVQSLATQTLMNDFSRSFISGLAFVLPLMYSIFVCSIFANYSVVVDKAKRNIESLMAAPVSIEQIWLGKSLAVAMPSFAVGFSVSVLAYLVINFAFVMPHTHFSIFPDPLAIISAVFIIPLLIFAIVSIVIDIQLVIANPRIANLVFTGMFVLILFGVNLLGGLGVSTSAFPLAYLGMIAVCAIASYILSRSLTKEKVLLSSKM
jgi:ABC-2 type transport system permease protein